MGIGWSESSRDDNDRIFLASTVGTRKVVYALNLYQFDHAFFQKKILVVVFDTPCANSS
jgi:hypothetical protein